MVKKLGMELAKLEGVEDPELHYEIYEEKYDQKARVLLEAIGIEDMLSVDSIAEALYVEDYEYWSGGDFFESVRSHKTREFARAVINKLRDATDL